MNQQLTQGKPTPLSPHPKKLTGDSQTSGGVLQQSQYDWAVLAVFSSEFPLEAVGEAADAGRNMKRLNGIVA